MNALNILTGKSPASPPRSRTSSFDDIHTLSNGAQNPQSSAKVTHGDGEVISAEEQEPTPQEAADEFPDEKTALLREDGFQVEEPHKASRSWRLIPKRILDALVTSAKVVITTIAAPAQYVVACFFDVDGHFSAILPIRRLYHVSSRRRRREAFQAEANRSVGAQEDDLHSEKPRLRPKREDDDETTYTTTDGDDTATKAADYKHALRFEDAESDNGPAQNTRSKTAAGEETAPAKRSIRIKLHNEASHKPRHRSQKSLDGSATEEDRVAAVASALKSPSGPTVAAKLKYPRAPAPPRPLVPRRQPSYTTSLHAEAPKKTLVIDLDETLIHSMAKGGRLSTGHMVEVKLQGPVGANGTVLGPQVPILYYVHERPYCHEFLKKISKWYSLIVFTASVQEYADPVIDWLERERTYFSGRYYRQHCTFRNGAYIKDLTQVEPDLSKVMILDNSPMSYIFHEDNAIPIEGWISDPTDSDLLHLVPLLEGLQYATDVRALLALRLGQAERS